ncbi:unnamed protein product [Urochloa humidicola]
MSESLALVASLFATAAFAAGFDMPGGHSEQSAGFNMTSGNSSEKLGEANLTGMLEIKIH